MPYRILIDHLNIVRVAEFVDFPSDTDIEVTYAQFVLAIDNLGVARWENDALVLPTTPTPPPPVEVPSPRPGYTVTVDENDIVTGVHHVNAIEPEDIEISEAYYWTLVDKIGQYRFQNGMIVELPPPEPPAPGPFYRLVLDGDGVITAAEVVEALEAGDVEITAAQAAEAAAFIGTARWVDGAIVLLPPVTTAQPRMLAIAQLTISGDEIQGIETAVGIGFAFPVDINIFWVFFPEPQPDADYIVFVQSPGFDVDVTDRQADYFEITATDRATGEAATPSRLSLSVQRIL